MPDFKVGKVVSVNHPASTYTDIVFETAEPLVFIPGQFISIRVNQRDMRSYSIAGKVGEKSYGLIVDVKPAGPGSQFFEQVKVGDEFNFLGPVGRFVYQPNDGAEELLFLATGTGIAPLKAMMEQALATGDRRKMSIFFGLRYLEDIFWDDYFNRMQANNPNVRFVLCLSKPDERWNGVVGHNTDLIEVEYQDLSHACAYLCGNGNMILEARELLARKGMPPERIYSEKFF